MSYGRNTPIKGDERTKLAARLAAQYEGGASTRAIARDTGRSYGCVRQLLIEAGVQFRPRGGDRRSVGRRV